MLPTREGPDPEPALRDTLGCRFVPHPALANETPARAIRALLPLVRLVRASAPRRRQAGRRTVARMTDDELPMSPAGANEPRRRFEGEDIGLQRTGSQQIGSQSIGVRSIGASTDGRRSVGALAIGATAAGALAIGAFAIGALAIGRLTIGKARMKHLDVQTLHIGRLVVDALELREPG